MTRKNNTYIDVIHKTFDVFNDKEVGFYKVMKRTLETFEELRREGKYSVAARYMEMLHKTYQSFFDALAKHKKAEASVIKKGIGFGKSQEDIANSLDQIKELVEKVDKIVQ